jgi:hypothetical protein
MSSFGAIKKASHENTKQSGLEKTIHVGLVSLLVAGVVVNRFLTQGVGG